MGARIGHHLRAVVVMMRVLMAGITSQSLVLTIAFEIAIFLLPFLDFDDLYESIHAKVRIFDYH